MYSRFLLVFCLIFIIFSLSHAQGKKLRKVTGGDVVISIDTIKVDKSGGSSVYVPVRVKNFQDIGAITLKITFDTLNLQYKGISNITGIKFTTYSCRNGVITIGWFDPTGGVAGGNVNDGKFFDIYFSLTGDKSDVKFISDQCDIADKNVKTLKVTYIDGAVLPGTSSAGKIKKKTTNFKLGQNFPNPFNPTTRIDYSIPLESDVSLKVFNLIGQEITTLVNKQTPAGDYSVNFKAEGLPSGVYLYRLSAGGYVQTNKMILAK